MPETANTQTQDETEGVNRLMGMVVQEVSLVDRAANQRKFLVVKRDPMATPVKKDDNAAQPALPGGTNQPAPAKLAPMQAQVKDALLSALTAASEKLVTLAQAVKDVEVTDQQADPPVPASVTGQIGEIGSMLSGLCAQFGGAAPSADGTPADPTKAAGLPNASDNGGPGQLGEQKRDAATVSKALQLFKVHEATLRAGNDVTLKGAEVVTMGLALGVVQKAGKKMAKERLERFRKAMDMLAGILKELNTDKMRKSVSAGAPTVVTMKAAVAKELVEAVDLLTATLEKRDATIVTLTAENTKIRKAAGVSNSSEAPGSHKRPSTGNVSWPLDMNAPIEAESAATDFGHKKAAGGAR